MIVKFENQSKRKFLPVCWTRAGSGKVEDGEAYTPSQIGNVEGGTERRGEAGQGQGNKRSGWLVAHSLLCFVCCL